MSERRPHWDDFYTGTVDYAAALAAYRLRVRAEKAEAAIARVRALAEQASTVIARGCTCYGDDCTGKCRRGEPLGWDLNPAEVLRALDGDSDG